MNPYILIGAAIGGVIGWLATEKKVEAEPAKPVETDDERLRRVEANRPAAPAPVETPAESKPAKKAKPKSEPETPVESESEPAPE